MTHPYLIVGALLLAWLFGGDRYGAYVERKRVVAFLRRAAQALPTATYREEGSQAVARLADEIAGNKHRGYPSMGDRREPGLPAMSADVQASLGLIHRVAPAIDKLDAPPITSVPEPARPTSSKRPAPLPPIESPGPREILE
jgi:hypothetical protein